MLQVVMLALAAVLAVIDQVTKYIAVLSLKGQPSVPIFGNAFVLQYCENPGVAFSMLENQGWFFVPVTCVVMLLLVVMMFRSVLRDRWLFSLGLALILSGGIGNLIDRIANGYVVDFLYFKLIDFPIFNFADCCVVVGAVLLFAFLLFGCQDSDLTSVRALMFGTKSTKKEITDDSRNENVDHSE